MMFYMDSKTFQNEFLTNETDKSILKAQYVMVSARIRKKDSKGEFKNIMSGMNTLYPESYIMSAIDIDEGIDLYEKQLNNNKPLIATLILGSIEEKFNIIFICTKNEYKFHYLNWLANYIYMEFDYPVYEYKAYANSYCELRKYNKEKVVKQCKEVLKKAKKQQYEKDLTTLAGRKSIAQSIKKMSKSELKKKLKKKNLYRNGMLKSEMREMLELFPE